MTPNLYRDRMTIKKIRKKERKKETEKESTKLPLDTIDSHLVH